jgi:hypothetical protein
MGRGRRRKQLLGDLEEKITHWYLKRKALHHNVCGETGYGKGYGPVEDRLGYERPKIQTQISIFRYCTFTCVYNMPEIVPRS